MAAFDVAGARQWPMDTFIAVMSPPGARHESGQEFLASAWTFFVYHHAVRERKCLSAQRLSWLSCEHHTPGISFHRDLRS